MGWRVTWSVRGRIILYRTGYVFAIEDNHPKLAEAIRKHLELVHEEVLTNHRAKSKQISDNRGCRRKVGFCTVRSVAESLRSLTKHRVRTNSAGQAITHIKAAGQCRVEVQNILLSGDSKFR